jgi:hypothetical protein
VGVIVKSLPVWLLIVPLAVLNGLMRDSIMQPLLGRYALPANGITLCALVLALTWFFIAKLGVVDLSQYWLVGVVWVGLAIVFECLLGLALGRTLADMLAAYDVTSGNLWLLVVICVGTAPWLAAKMRGLA